MTGPNLFTPEVKLPAVNDAKLEYRAFKDGKMYRNIEYITMSGDIKTGSGEIIISPILMQFTGLRDRKSAKIFTADMVYDGLLGIGVIEFSHGVFGINWDYLTPEKKSMQSNMLAIQHNLRTLDDGYNEQIQIIGNIYEHPQLLDKKPL